MSFNTPILMNGVLAEVIPPKICFGLHEVLTMYFGANALVHDLPDNGTSSVALKEVLGYISYRTLGFGKVFEYIRYNDFLSSSTDSGYYSLGLSRGTLNRAIHNLRDAGLIITFLDKSRRKLYVSLDLLNVVTKLNDHFSAAIDMKYRRVWKSLDILAEAFQDSRFMLAGKQIQLFGGQVCNENRVGEFLSMAGSFSKDTLVGTVEAKCEAAKAKKLTKKIDDGVVAALLSTNALSTDPTWLAAVWNKALTDSDLYPNAIPVTIAGKKHRNTVALVLKKFEAEGLTPDQIKREVEIIIDGWGRIPKKKRTIMCSFDGGAPYPKAIKEVPDFNTLCWGVDQIRPMCREYSVLSQLDPNKSLISSTEQNKTCVAVVEDDDISPFAL